MTNNTDPVSTGENILPHMLTASMQLEMEATDKKHNNHAPLMMLMWGILAWTGWWRHDGLEWCRMTNMDGLGWAHGREVDELVGAMLVLRVTCQPSAVWQVTEWYIGLKSTTEETLCLQNPVSSGIAFYKQPPETAIVQRRWEPRKF